MAAVSMEETPRQPKSLRANWTSRKSVPQPVFSRASTMTFFCSRDCVATVIGYHTCTSE